MQISKRTIVAASVLLVLAGVAGLGWIYSGDPRENSDRLELLGNVDVRQVNLAFEVAGRVATVTQEEGDTVATGQTVASLETADFEDEVRLARSRLERQAAVLAALEAGTRPAEIDQARARVMQHEAALRLAQATLRRQQELAARNLASHQVHDEAKARLDEARAQLRAAEKALALAEAGPRREDIEQARAQLNADRAALNLAQRRLADATLIAPNGGIILTRVREPGTVVAPGDTIYTLSLTSPVWIRTYVDEPELGRIYPGMPAEIHTDSGGIYRGQVGFISPRAEFTPKTVETRELRTSLVYRLRVIVENPDNGLRQGMPVTVVLQPNQGDES
ncbi:efflux RND transporter periplasmic adaptor subunit [Halomonas beimenensis]|uniref:Putative membrane fusion protein (MFP) component of efflux pump, membrane anchor protein YbhG n=1 Tax=Halomonas beimenensis TaxID=475662 RepID=A0A291P915_9GAMM|nr:efflux RND transporter periplasmic adaptor subunit [Halomonas beimenensis]ATJ83351.1 putative membrane fusion protein (MFP) component of efflux pump, membrane anchor protein YbhG [Halomonas beimenensis]